MSYVPEPIDDCIGGDATDIVRINLAFHNVIMTRRNYRPVELERQAQRWQFLSLQMIAGGVLQLALVSSTLFPTVRMYRILMQKLACAPQHTDNAC